MPAPAAAAEEEEEEEAARQMGHQMDPREQEELEDPQVLLLECGDLLSSYLRRGVKSAEECLEVIHELKRCEQALRETQQGNKDIQAAARGNFSTALLKVITKKLPQTLDVLGGANERRRGGGGGRRRGERNRPNSHKKTTTTERERKDVTTTSARPKTRGGSAVTSTKHNETGDLYSVDPVVELHAVCACCFVLLLRLFAPECPFSDKDLENVFVKGLFAQHGGIVPVLLGSAGGHVDDNMYKRGVFLLETLREVKACLLVLDFHSDDALVCLISCLLESVDSDNISDTKDAIVLLLSEVLEEGGADLTPRVWDTFLARVIEEAPPLVIRSSSSSSSSSERDGGDSSNSSNSNMEEEEEEMEIEEGGHQQHVFLRGEETSSSTVVVARELLKSVCRKQSLGKPFHRFLLEQLKEDDYHSLLYSLYKVDPSLLIPVIPKLADDFSAVNFKRRLQTVELMGQFLLSDFRFADKYGSLFQTFLGRFMDKKKEIRLKMVTVAECLLVKCMHESNNNEMTANSPASKIKECLLDKLHDGDEKVREAAVAAAGRMLCIAPATACSTQQYDNFLGRLRDAKLPVRKQAAVQLASMFSSHIQRIHNDAGSWQDEERASVIPVLLLRSYYQDKELRVAALEQVLCSHLFPKSLSVEEVVQHWVVIFSNSDTDAQASLFRCLEMKAALRNSLVQFAILREEGKKCTSEEAKAYWLKKCSTHCHKIASLWLSSNSLDKSSSSLQRMLELKDNKVFKNLTALVECTNLDEALEIKATLLQLVHYNKDIQTAVSQICNYLVYSPFGEDHVESLILSLAEMESRDEDMFVHSRNLAVKLAAADPALFRKHSALLSRVLKVQEEDISLTGLELLAMTHSKKRSHSKAFYSMDTKSEKIIVGYVSHPRREVSARAVALLHSAAEAGGAGGPNEGGKADKLLKEQARKALRKLNTQRNESKRIEAFGTLASIAYVQPGVIKESMLDIVNSVCSVLTADHQQNTEDDGKLVISAVACLSALLAPRDGSGMDDLPEDVTSAIPDAVQYVANQLSLEEEEATGACPRSKKEKEMQGEVRLASAKAILQVARKHDASIPLNVYREVCLVMQDPIRVVRESFASSLNDLVKYFQSRALVKHAAKYAAAFSLAGADPSKENKGKVVKYLLRFFWDGTKIKNHYLNRGGKAASRGEQSNSNNRNCDALYSPEYVLVYAVHLLAHHPDFPTKEDLEEFGVNESLDAFQQQLMMVLDMCVMAPAQFPQCKVDMGLVEKIFKTIKHHASEPAACLSDIASLLAEQLVGMEGVSYCSSSLQGVPLPRGLYQKDKNKSSSTTKGSLVPEGLVLLAPTAELTEKKRPRSKPTVAASRKLAATSASKKVCVKNEKKEPLRELNANSTE